MLLTLSQPLVVTGRGSFGGHQPVTALFPLHHTQKSPHSCSSSSYNPYTSGPHRCSDRAQQHRFSSHNQRRLVYVSGVGKEGAADGGSSSADEEKADDEDSPPVLGDWREFRAKLVSQAEPTPVRQSEDNVKLLEMQNPSLAAEGYWAHATGRIEKGGLLIAKPDTADVLDNQRLWQSVIFLVAHNHQGSLGLILNRPTSLVFGKKAVDKRSGLPFEVSNAVAELQAVFADNIVYMGGTTAQQIVHMLHGYDLPRSVEIVPGIHVGGEAAAASLVSPKGSGEGGPSPDNFKFFSGAVVWEPGQLQAEVDRGAWINAACSRSLVLKQCLQLPVPLWREVLLLMGGPYVDIAAAGYEGDE